MEPITFQALKDYGFQEWNKLFDYRCFPSPMGGNYRIEPLSPTQIRWKIYFTDGRIDIPLRCVETMQQVKNFYKGMCDKDLTLTQL